MLKRCIEEVFYGSFTFYFSLVTFNLLIWHIDPSTLFFLSNLAFFFSPIRNGRRTGSSSTPPAKMASPAWSFTTRLPAEVGLAEAREAVPTRKPGSWTRRSSACRSASPFCPLWQRAVPKKTWQRFVWKQMTRRTCLQQKRTQPRSGWTPCVTLRFRYLYISPCICQKAGWPVRLLVLL